MMTRRLCLCFVFCAFLYSVRSQKGTCQPMPQCQPKCQPIEINFCKELDYQYTEMPNHLGHVEQREAAMEANQFYPLVKVQCSPYLRFFLCTMYVPVCTQLEKPIKPCRSLCKKAKSGCDVLMERFGFAWPENLDCEKLPRMSEEICVGENSTSSGSPVVPPQKPNGKDPRIDLPPAHSTRRPPSNGSDMLMFHCPTEYQVTSDAYVVQIDELRPVTPRCAVPCEDDVGFWFTKRDSFEYKFTRYWTGIWSILCFVSTLFTVLTFLVDMQRFRYPERPIIFISMCYCMVSIGYMAGFFAGQSRFACSDLGKGPMVTQGSSNEGCTALFLIIYFSSMASAVWWVILCLTWYLAAGRKWAAEAIEGYAHFFHVTAWALPAAQTIVVLTTGHVGGDPLTGVCYTGLSRLMPLRWFVLTPLVLYLCVGSIFLLLGFVSLFRIRTIMKTDGTSTDKLTKLMIRIGVFSVLYLVPALFIIGSHFYELANREKWNMVWWRQVCNEHAEPCPFPPTGAKGSVIISHHHQQPQPDERPDFTLVIIKYLMTLVVGITSGFWIWSKKTLRTWHRFCCCAPAADDNYLHGKRPPQGVVI